MFFEIIVSDCFFLSFHQTIGRFLPDGDGSPLQDDLFGLEAEEEGETGLYKTLTVSVHRKKRSSSTNSVRGKLDRLTILTVFGHFNRNIAVIG